MLHLHTAAGTTALEHGLARLLAEPLADPFDEEVVVVAAKGVERWLAQRLSHELGVGPRGGDGVCAGVRFLRPASLVAMLTGTEDDDPWSPDRLVWPVLDTIDDSLGEPWCAQLARHLGYGGSGTVDELRRDRRWAVAHRIAGLFASYGVQRPRLLADWSEGRDTDGCAGGLPADQQWEAELWRRTAERVDAPIPPVRHERTLAAIRDGADLALPQRLSLFGHTRLPQSELDLVRAVGEVRDVHLWLPTGSPAAWQRLAPAVVEGPVRRREDDSVRVVRHRLLSSLGRDARELQRSLTLLGPVEHQVDDEVLPTSDSLLGWLQHDLRADDAPSDDVRQERTHRAGDRSVQVHAAHGPARQVEVLRDVLAGLLQDDPTLEPRDVIIMCPDVEAYAPLFSASFGLVDAGEEVHPAHGLRLRLADRGLAGTNPMLELALRLLDLAGGRATSGEVLDLLGSDPVRHRFRLDEDDLAVLADWAVDSGARWGLTARLRSRYELAGVPQNTWSAGLDRVLLGVASDEHSGQTVGGVLPLDDVGSSSIELAGRLAEVLGRVERTVVALEGATSATEWMTRLREGALALGSVPATDAWQVAQLTRVLDQVTAAATVAGGAGAVLRLADVRRLLEQAVAPRPTRASFRSGHLTVCSMVPMRSVPHRVVCLVGLDDGTFPRGTVVDGDDVLLRDPMTGERDPRSEDRQLLLDAVLAAQDALVVTYTGANEQTGQPRPPAVPVGELLDALDETAVGPVRERVLTHHPLQPFDRRGFVAGALATQGPFSFDRTALEGARAAARPPRRRARLVDERLPEHDTTDIALADLRAFLKHPVRGFLSQALGVALPRQVDEQPDTIPLELGGLEKYGIGDRILTAALAGGEQQAQRAVAAERARGQLPPAALGEVPLDEISRQAFAIYEASVADRQGEPRGVDVDLTLPDGRRLTGVVDGVWGDRLVRVRYSSLRHPHWLEAYVDLLALTAQHPDRQWSARAWGWHRPSSRRPGVVGSVSFAPIEPTEALASLGRLADLRDRGLREVLPLPPAASAAYVARLVAGGRPGDTYHARQAWEGGWLPGDRDDDACSMVWGSTAPFGDIASTPPQDDEVWVAAEQTRFGQYARRLWEEVLTRGEQS